MTAMLAANHTNGIKAIVALTESGSSALVMSRLSSGLPIYALSSNSQTLNYCAIYSGVTPLRFNPTTTDNVKLPQNEVDTPKEAGFLKDGNKLILKHGDDNNTGKQQL